MRVATVLQANRDFRPEYVVRLYEGVRANWSGKLEFLCLTDTPIGHPGVTEIPLKHRWPRYWCKLNLCDPDLAGDILYFDLDTMVIGSLASFQRARGTVMLGTFTRKPHLRFNSSIMRLPEEFRALCWSAFIKNPGQMIRRFRWGASHPLAWGDQGFTQWVAEENRWEVDTWQGYWAPMQIESYKHDVRPRGAVGRHTRVVVFHGRPRPADLGWTLPEREEAAA